jgi:hypothetical protein
MIHVKLSTTEGPLPIAFPSKLDEITIGQMQDLQEAGVKGELTDIKSIAILTGIDEEKLLAVRNYADLGQFLPYTQSLVHQWTYDFKSEAIPKKVIIDGKEVKVINNLSIEPAGAFMNARDIIADEINEHIALYDEEDWKNHFQPSISACVKVLAHYFFHPVTGEKYAEHKVENESFLSKIRNIKLIEAFPIARFFFLSYPNLYRPKIGFWKRLKISWRNELVRRRLKRSATGTR